MAAARGCDFGTLIGVSEHFSDLYSFGFGEGVEVHLNALTRALASRSLRMYVARCSVDSINQFALQHLVEGCCITTKLR